MAHTRLTLMNLTDQSDAVTGSTFTVYPDHTNQVRNFSNAFSGVCTFDISDSTATVQLQGSIDGTNFVTVKEVSRVGSDILEGYSVTIFPFMRAKVSSAGTNANIKVMVAYS